MTLLVINLIPSSATASSSKSNITIKSGKFKLVIHRDEDIQVVEMDASSQFAIEDDFSLKLTLGQFYFKGPINFKTDLASFSPRSSDFTLMMEPELTTITVFDGELVLKSLVDEEIIPSGHISSMNKKGKIKKPKELKEEAARIQTDYIESIFLIQNR